MARFNFLSQPCLKCHGFNLLHLLRSETAVSTHHHEGFCVKVLALAKRNGDVVFDNVAVAVVAEPVIGLLSSIFWDGGGVDGLNLNFAAIF